MLLLHSDVLSSHMTSLGSAVLSLCAAGSSAGTDASLRGACSIETLPTSILSEGEPTLSVV